MERVETVHGDCGDSGMDSGAQVWNNVPPELRQATPLTELRTELSYHSKGHCFYTVSMRIYVMSLKLIRKIGR